MYIIGIIYNIISASKPVSLYTFKIVKYITNLHMSRMYLILYPKYNKVVNYNISYIIQDGQNR